MTKTINTESFTEAWKGKRCLRGINSVSISYVGDFCTRIRLQILVLVLASHASLD